MSKRSAALVGKTLPHVSRANLVSMPRERLIWDSLRLLRSVLFSEEVRREVRKLPLVKSLEKAIYEKMQHLSTETQQRLRIALTGPLSFQKNGTVPPKALAAEDPLIAVQSRTVAHSSEKAKRLLGYSSPVSYREGMALTETWLRHAHFV